MSKSDSERAADSLINGVSRYDWNPYLFASYIMGQSPYIQQKIIEAFVIYLELYKRNANNPAMGWRVGENGSYIAEGIDLTEFDQ